MLVKLSPIRGGGIAKLLSSDGMSSVIVTADGKISTVPTADIDSGIDPTQYPITGDHNATINKDLLPGCVVHVSGAYGLGNGSAFGTFVGYSLDGLSAIVNMDGNNMVVPVSLVTKAPEKTDHAETPNPDGQHSPMTYGGALTTEPESEEDIQKWVEMIKAEIEKEEAEKEENVVASPTNVFYIDGEMSPEKIAEIVAMIKQDDAQA